MIMFMVNINILIAYTLYTESCKSDYNYMLELDGSKDYIDRLCVHIVFHIGNPVKVLTIFGAAPSYNHITQNC